MIRRFLDSLRAQGWEVKTGPNPPLPEAVTGRYRELPDLWLQFIETVCTLAGGDEKVWFLCAEDYDTHIDHAWQWNEWERLSLESAEGDESWTDEIKAFWDDHLPIVLSLRDGYAYYAISMADGAVVYGAEPEFEACRQVAGSFMEFIGKVTDGTITL